MGNKCDMDEAKRKVPYSKGQALADEFGIRFFETSAKTNSNVEEVNTSINGSSEGRPKLSRAIDCSVSVLGMGIHKKANLHHILEDYSEKMTTFEELMCSSLSQQSWPLQVFQTIAKEVVARLRDSQEQQAAGLQGPPPGVRVGLHAPTRKPKKSGCC